MQALENVAGASTVSEGQSAVPALRGMARGRTLILIDGSRVTAERRVGPAATFLDPFVLENVEVSRGPGSVAYGSDAFGGVILARTRRVPFGSPLAVDATASLGAGVPQGRAGVSLGKGFERGSVGVQGHYREAEDWRSPEGEVLNSGWQDSGFALRGEHEVGQGILAASFQSDFGRDVERPRNNSNVTRFYYPTEDSHRFTTTYDLRGRLARSPAPSSAGSWARTPSSPIRTAIPTATVTRRIERADVSANDFHVRGSAEKQAGRGKFEVGADVNGRFDLHALDVLVEFNSAGAQTAETVNVSVDNAHQARRGGLSPGRVPRCGAPCSQPPACAAIRVTTENTGGFFGDRSTSNGAFSGFAA